MSDPKDEFHEENLRHFEHLFNEGQYVKFCREFCHEGLMVWYPYGFDKGVQVSVCSEMIEAETAEEGIKTLAHQLFQRMKTKGDEGC